MFDEKVLYYSEDWVMTQKKWWSFAIISTQYVDILVDGEYLYLLSLTERNSSNLGTALLMTGGAIGGALSVFSMKKKQKGRMLYREKWVDEKRNIISNKYLENVFLKIPKNDIETAISYRSRRSLWVKYNKKKMIIENKEEFKNLQQFLESFE